MSTTPRRTRRPAVAVAAAVLTALGAVTTLPAAPAAAQPGNDDVAHAAILSVHHTADLTQATAEPTDPRINDVTSAATVWYRAQPAGDVVLTIDLSGSDLDTLLGVYTVADDGTLVELASDDDSGEGYTSRIAELQLHASHTYYVMAAGYGDERGQLEVSTTSTIRASNDDFADRRPLQQVSYGATMNATLEVGEPSHGATGPSNTSVWWEYRPAHDGFVTLSLDGSDDVDTVMALHTGETLAALSRLAWDDDSGPGRLSELRRIPVHAGTVYQLAITVDTFVFGALRITEHLDGAVPVSFTRATRAVPARGGGLVTLHGSGLYPGSAVVLRCGQQQRVLGPVSARADGTRLTVRVPRFSPGRYRVRVQNPFVTSAPSAGPQLTVLARPRVTRLSRTSGPVTGGTRVLLRGPDMRFTRAVLVDGRRVRFGRAGAAIRIAMPRHRAGTVAIRVVTVGGTSAATRPSRFTYRR